MKPFNYLLSTFTNTLSKKTNHRLLFQTTQQLFYNNFFSINLILNYSHRRNPLRGKENKENPYEKAKAKNPSNYSYPIFVGENSSKNYVNEHIMTDDPRRLNPRHSHPKPTKDWSLELRDEGVSKEQKRKWKRGWKTLDVNNNELFK
ncbi:hypothetical protein ABK040_008609 [Willaertia magna]